MQHNETLLWPCRRQTDVRFFIFFIILINALSLISTGMHPLPTLLSSGLTSAQRVMMVTTREGRMSVSNLLTFVLAQHPDVYNSNLGTDYYGTDTHDSHGYYSACIVTSPVITI